MTVANFGFSSLWPLAKLVLLVHFAILFFALVVLGIVARLCGLSVWILIRILKDELILAYSASSESVLPRIIEDGSLRLASITSFVVPTGYSFNLMVRRCIKVLPLFSSLSCMALTCPSGGKSFWC